MPSFATLLALAAPLAVLGAPIKRDKATDLLVLSALPPSCVPPNHVLIKQSPRVPICRVRGCS